MSALSSRGPASRRHSQVFVEIPPSPYDGHPTAKGASSSSSLSTPTMSSLKENSPLKPTRTNSNSTTLTTISSLSSASRKRTLSSDGERVEVVIAQPPAKKPKVTKAEEPKKTKSSKPIDNERPSAKLKAAKGTDLAPEQSTEHAYCHQCTKKRDASEVVQCTRLLETTKGKIYRCRKKMCARCIKNRYKRDFNTILATAKSSLPKSQRSLHVSDEDYYYSCPACEGDCNCKNCRRAQGLPPTGRIRETQNPGDEANPKAKVESKSKTKAKSTSKDATHNGSTYKNVKTTTKASTSIATTSKPAAVPKPKTAPKPQPKALPQVTWTTLPIYLPRSDVEDRIFIREFARRFAPTLQLANTHADELEELVGPSLGSPEFEHDVELFGWVSEAAVKPIIIGLLDILASAADDARASAQAKAIKEAIKDIRLSGANLNRIWVALESVRAVTNVAGSPYRVSFPDPLPPPPNVTYRSTRSAGNTKASAANVNVTSTAQLIPVIVKLIELAIPSPLIREAIDVGVAAEKELAKDVREAVSKEKAIWQETKDTEQVKRDLKANRERHKQHLVDLEYAHRLLSLHYAPRFGPLGKDHEGRVYYILNPSASEADAAEQLIHGKPMKIKFGRKRGGVTIEDRKGLERWSWFVAVYGPQPLGANVVSLNDDDDHNSIGDDESWWAFWEPSELTKLAEWLEIKHSIDNDMSDRRRSSPFVNGSSNKGKGVDGRNAAPSSILSLSREPSPLSDLSDGQDSDIEMRDGDDKQELSPYATPGELHTLVKNLKEYADLLQWRIQRASVTTEEPKEEVLTATRTRSGAVPASKFYS
ncbi:hypothetical protein K474DRAFT_1664607 [Panus rudis PR-1116 ss-1]|nr:hypothetical protein K474DRAFT_1664607 [Panus rudis PR-1116 ss-1]